MVGLIVVFYRALLGNVLLGNRLEGYFAKPQRDGLYGGSVNFGFSVTLKTLI